MTVTVPQLGDLVGPAPATTRSVGPATTRYTIDSLARLVGMSPRNIRAHQARGLLAPPTRSGRTAYYSPGHVRRLESIKSLQRQGFNLVAIEAMLGVRNPAPPATEPLTAALNRLAAEHPALLHNLARHGVLARAGDGSVTATRPRAVQPALDLHQAGVPVLAALRLLGELLDRLRPVTDELVPAAGTRLSQLRRTGAPGTSRQQPDHETAALTQSLARLLSEAFRVVAENSCTVTTTGADTASTTGADRDRWPCAVGARHGCQAVASRPA
ncbi:MerR family transcriptional regulator [Micromonospora sp. WMMD1102]|uniref:MerR family transcriptional regulator n=1 Tax=Micromonospora sp. WMMD1102 TaxID=3016105 RepID=UPI002415017F|nr:MerR family transcriptional regulator [Micromonospora sp. WMMD1102]MDG4786496.1 MerR family transcriptional regulator [Micromonospora sp. WMMD1102]